MEQRAEFGTVLAPLGDDPGVGAENRSKDASRFFGYYLDISF